jgi:predicted short-subunit dehydrogenase-like oxidoreductase (DUF2520 family)
MVKRVGGQDVFIVGAGRAGAAMARALHRSSHRVLGTWNRSAAAAAHVRSSTGLPAFHGRIPQVARQASIVLVGVKDDALPVVAYRLLRDQAVERGSVVAHLAGALDCEVLAPLRRAGASVGSLHPVGSFTDGSSLPAGTHFAVEGDAAAVRVLRQLAVDLAGTPVIIEPGRKPTYHAALVFGSNYLVALAAIATRLLNTCGLDEESARALLAPLLEGTARNICRGGVGDALTGPITRGDVETVRLHLSSLRGDPELADLYCTLGRRALEVARGEGLAEPLAEALAVELLPRARPRA